METLSDVAVGEERLDLELVGGLSVLVKIVDNGAYYGRDHIHDYGGSSSSSSSSSSSLNYESSGSEVAIVNQNINSDAKEALRQLFKLFDGVNDAEEEWTKDKLESKMNEAIRILSEGSLPNVLDEKEKKKNHVAGSLDVSHPFCYLRQFVVDEEKDGANVTEETNHNDSDSNINKGLIDPAIQEQINTLNNITQHALASSTTLYRILLLRSTAQTILDNWDRLTTITSGDVDRAAVSKIELPTSQQRGTVNAKCVREVFEAYAYRTPQEWVQSWWKLIDADNDGLIDQEEMNTCVDMTLAPVHLALGEVFDLSLQVCPVRTIGMGGEEEAKKKNAWFLGVESEQGMDDIPTTTTMPVAKLSWRNRRKELKEQKILRKAFRGTVERHFRDQAEAPHRLRCIYAWAEKEHQGNKLDSVLVDASEEWGSGSAASAVMGRKRYVELEPKISYAEFREVQKKTFPHLDRIGEEIVTSFKEDLWLLQGTKRQNKELKKDGLLFLLGISIVDLGISMV